MRLKAYPAYGSSGTEWLEKIPDEWKMLRLKLLSKKIGSGKTPRGGSQVYSDSGVVFLRSQNVYDDGLRLDDVVHIDDEVHEEMSETKVLPRDVLLNITGASIGRTCIVPDSLPEANVNQHVCIIRLCHRVYSEFISYSLKSQYIKDQIQSMQNGSSREGLNFEQVGSLILPVPFDDPVTQLAIASFLDRETSRIDTLIAKKERQIELLQEKRAALISHAVTKGLDPNVKMKDSGKPGWGMIPAHWQMKQLRHLVPADRQIMYGIVLPGPDFEGGIPIVKGGNCEPGRLCLEIMSRTSPEIESKHVRSRLKAGDIVYSIRGSIGSAELVPPELEAANLTQDAARISPCPKINNRWLLYAVRSQVFFSKLDSQATGATIRGINIFDLKRGYIAVPPANEQDDIASFLQEEDGRSECLLQKVHDSISTLHKYRTALISAAVTGKIDVRGERANTQDDPSVTELKEISHAHRS